MLTYTLISSRSEDVRAVYRNIKGLGKDAVRRIFLVYGAYDILAEVKANDEGRMKDLLDTIKAVDGVMNMKTLIVVHKTREDDKIPKYLFTQ